MIEQTFGVRLLKEHSAADWSTRPLPAELAALRGPGRRAAGGAARRAGRQARRARASARSAEQEFAALVAGAGVPGPPPDRPVAAYVGHPPPLRPASRSGPGRVALERRGTPSRGGLTAAPRRVLPTPPSRRGRRSRHPGPRGAPARPRLLPPAGQAVRVPTGWPPSARSSRCPTTSPALHLAADGPPQTRVWASKNPEAAARLARVREALTARAEELDLPVENLLTPERVRRLAWTPPRS